MKAKRSVPAQCLGAAVSPELLPKRTKGGRWSYSGSQEQLIAAGLVREADFPAAPAMSRTFVRDDRRMALMVAARLAGPMTFRLYVDEGTISEAKARHLEWEREYELKQRARAAKQREEAERAQAAAAAAVAEIPTSAAEYVDRAVRAFYHTVRTHLRPALTGEFSEWMRLLGLHDLAGYQLDADSLAAFDEAIDDAAETLRSARAIVSKKSRQAAIVGIRGKAAREDLEFGSFMRRAGAAD